MTPAVGFAAGTAVDDEIASLTRLTIGLDVSRRFRADGFVRLDGLWSDALADALEAEALAREAAALWPASAPGPDSVRSRHRAPARQVTVDAAPLLAGLHGALARLARVLSTRVVAPSVGNYGYYEDDDACYLHVDVNDADVTFLTTVAGRIGPLHLHPELVGRAPAELHALEADPRWDRQSGQRLAYPRHGVAAIRGRDLPHHRPGTSVTGPTIVAALQYGARF